jgi:hypothetical protein
MYYHVFVILFSVSNFFVTSSFRIFTAFSHIWLLYVIHRLRTHIVASSISYGDEIRWRRAQSSKLRVWMTNNLRVLSLSWGPMLNPHGKCYNGKTNPLVSVCWHHLINHRSWDQHYLPSFIHALTEMGPTPTPNTHNFFHAGQTINFPKGPNRKICIYNCVYIAYD